MKNRESSMGCLSFFEIGSILLPLVKPTRLIAHLGLFLTCLLPPFPASKVLAGLESPEAIAVDPAADRIFCSESYYLKSAQLDGSNSRVLFEFPSFTSIRGLAPHTRNRKIYVAQNVNLVRVTYDGVVLGPLNNRALGLGPTGVAVDEIQDDLEPKQKKKKRKKKSPKLTPTYTISIDILLENENARYSLSYTESLEAFSFSKSIPRRDNTYRAHEEILQSRRLFRFSNIDDILDGSSLTITS